MSSHNTPQFKVTTEGTKKEAIIRLKLVNPKQSLKEIARITKSNYDYTRRVWSRFVKKQVTSRGGPKDVFGVNVHGWFKWCRVQSVVYDLCPVKVSKNRNKQKVWRGRGVSLVFHKGGDLYCYPFSEGWEREVRLFLLGFVRDGGPHVDAILKSFVDHGKREIAFSTPGVSKNYNLRVKGVGSFKTDSTPYPSGTTEFEIDVGYDKRLKRIEMSLVKVAESNRVFARGMDQHMVLIGKLEDLVDSLQKVVEGLK